MIEATSVGGVIVRLNKNQPEILLIRDLSYDDWFLPKGHMEAGESEEDTARREIQEETGLKDLEMIGSLGSFKRYAEVAKEMKTQKFFLFKKTGNEEPVTENGKNWEIKWFTRDALPIFYISEQEAIVRDNWEQIEKV